MPRQSPMVRSARAAVPPTPTVHLSARCEIGQHAGCLGQVLNLTHVGPCQCHGQVTPEPAAA
jgi:hypothetical protein